MIPKRHITLLKGVRRQAALQKNINGRKLQFFKKFFNKRSIQNQWWRDGYGDVQL